MKGRRVARELALQALYELDQSSHAVADVIAARAEAYYRGVADASATETQRTALHRVLGGVDFRQPGESPWRALREQPDLAARLAIAPDELRQGLDLLGRHAPLVDYGLAIVRGVLAGLEAIDRVIGLIAPEWPVAQMAPVDRNTLRIALWEIGSRAVPTRVAINEAVELARRYSGESARRMVNGALGAFAKKALPLSLPPHVAPPGTAPASDADDAELRALEEPTGGSASAESADRPLDDQGALPGIDLQAVTLSPISPEPDEDWPLAPLADVHDGPSGD